MLLFTNILLVVSALIGMYCIAHQRKVGFVIFTLVEFSMFYIGWATGNYGLCIAASLYLVMNIYSYMQWTYKEEK